MNNLVECRCVLASVQIISQVASSQDITLVCTKIARRNDCGYEKISESVELMYRGNRGWRVVHADRQHFVIIRGSTGNNTRQNNYARMGCVECGGATGYLISIKSRAIKNNVSGYLAL